MAKLLIYNGTTPEWIEVNAANVDTAGEVPVLKFDTVENFAEDFIADTEDGAAKRAQLADLIAVNQDLADLIAAKQDFINNVSDDLAGEIIGLNYVQTEDNSAVNGIDDINMTVVGPIEITTSGSPVQIIATGDSNPQTEGAWVRLQLFRDNEPIGKRIHVESSTPDENTSYTLNYIDNPAAGTYSYSVKTVDQIAGEHNFGEVDGNHITVVELKGVKGDDGADGLPGSDNSSILEFIYLDSNQYEGNLNLQNENGKFILNLNDGLTEYINSINMNIADSHDVSLFSSHDIINSKKYQITMKDSNGKYNILSSSKQTILSDNYQSVGAIADLSSYTYRGFKVAINRIWGDDPSINQLIIYSENDNPVISVDGDTGDEDFAVTGLTNQSSIVAAINVYGNDSNNPIDGSRLIQFFITFVDHVIYTADVLNDINFIKLKFYNNFYKFKQLLSDVLYKKFTFNDFDNESGYGFNNINDGSDDQYDGGNYINTNLQSEIMYGNADANGQGEIQTGNDAAAAFGEGSSYVTLYKDSIFAMIATGASITSLSYSGDLGADGSGSEELLTQIEETPAFSIPYAVNFEDLEIVKVDSDFQISHEDVITFDFKVIGQAEQISTWFNPSSQNTWNIETYNSGGTFNLIAKNEGDPIPSVTWWDYQNTPTVKFYNNTNYFRGAIINYHALTDDGTIIGTIHISRDTGDNEVIHTESKSGGPNLNLHDLWYCEQEGVLKYRYDIEGVSHSPQTLRIHWTSTVFNGQDYWD